MAIYTCVACNNIFEHRLVITYMSWYKGEDLVRYRLVLCSDCTALLRDNCSDYGALRTESGLWVGPQAALPGVTSPGVPQNGQIKGNRASRR